MNGLLTHMLVTWEYSEYRPFTKDLRNKLIKMVSASLKSSGVQLSAKKGRVAAVEIDCLNTMGAKIPKWWDPRSNQNNWVCRDVWWWLIYHGVPRTVMSHLLHLYKQNKQNQNLISWQRSDMNQYTKCSYFLNKFPDLSQITHLETFFKGRD